MNDSTETRSALPTSHSKYEYPWLVGATRPFSEWSSGEVPRILSSGTTPKGLDQRWKPVGSTGTGRVDRPVGLRFFDQPVKPVETPVKFSFLATKRHISTNRNIHIFYHKENF